MCGGEVFIPKIPSMRITDLAEAIRPGVQDRLHRHPTGGKAPRSDDLARRGPRHGRDFRHVHPTAGPPLVGVHQLERCHALPRGFEYTSDTNDRWMTIAELQKIIVDHCGDTAPGRDGGTPIRTTMLPYGRQWIDEDDVAAVAETLRSDWLTTAPRSRNSSVPWRASPARPMPWRQQRHGRLARRVLRAGHRPWR